MENLKSSPTASTVRANHVDRHFQPLASRYDWSKRIYGRWLNHIGSHCAMDDRSDRYSSHHRKSYHSEVRKPCAHIEHSLWADAFKAAAHHQEALDSLIVAWQHYRSGASAVVVLTGARMACRLAPGEAVDALRCSVCRRVE